ncbi:MAG: hypothetical protein WCS28_02375 [Thiomicrospira sp.]|jgi:hypothetical protein
MFLSKVINIQSNTNTNDLLNFGRFNQLDDSEKKTVKDLAFFSFEEAKQRLSSIQSISKALETAILNADSGAFDPVQDGLNIAYWLTGEAQLIETLLELHEDASGIQSKQAGYETKT